MTGCLLECSDSPGIQLAVFIGNVIINRGSQFLNCPETSIKKQLLKNLMNRGNLPHSSSDHSEGSDPLEYHPNLPTIQLRKRKSKDNKFQMDQTSQEEYSNAEAELSQLLLVCQVESLLWVQQNEEQPTYLTKFQKQSYLHCKWLTQRELSENYFFSITPKTLKSMRKHMEKTISMRLKDQVFFNPNYIIPDRILKSTETFTSIHHRKANDIKGKWNQSLMIVISKLLNFSKEGFHYGVLLGQPYGAELERAHGISKDSSTNLGQILNKVYLDSYQDHNQFWMELGLALRNYIKIYSVPESDHHRVGMTMRQCSMFLYGQWHALLVERYRHVKRVMEDQEVFEISKHSVENDIFEEEESNNEFALLQRELCCANIFMTEKSVDIPKNPEELKLLNPGEVSFQWLGKGEEKDKCKNNFFRMINMQDMRNIDLNSEIDHLYLVKWRDLGYSQATWESDRLMLHTEKIQQFKRINKMPPKNIRDEQEECGKIHRLLLEKDKSKRQSVQASRQMAEKIYCLGKKKWDKPREYSEREAPVYKNYRKLKEFQLQSLNWLIKSWYENRNTILADEMGLGKTIQTISFLYHLHNHEGLLGPFLILAPLTTLPQWRREIEEWTHFNCLLYYDETGGHSRKIMQDYEFYYQHVTKSGEIIPSTIYKFNVLLTNYEMFVKEFDTLSKIPFQHMVLDEAHRLKNRKAHLTNVLSSLPCSRKTLLTGTPIQNSTQELWNLLNFIEPRIFHCEESFLTSYAHLNTEEQVKDFKRVLKPYILRRVKEDVESTIPKLSEIIVEVEMSNIQKAYYRSVLQKNKGAMLQGLSKTNFNSIAVQLRKCCNHPYLVSREVEEQLQKKCINDQQSLREFVKASGKIIILMKLLRKFKNESKKVLLFSQFVMLLEMLRPYLEIDGYHCELLSGNMSSTSRHQAITRFNRDEVEVDIFLISTKAGGVGINLVAATQIIIFDSDWNPQNDIQATARAHRIGQKKEVTVYRLITANTYESEMFKASSRKLGLDKAVFSGECFKSSGQFNEIETQLTKQEIETLLKKGILGFLENNTDADAFYEQSIEDILSKNSHRVEYQVPQSSCTFSKTKFKSEENSARIDAPDFWDLALKEIETPIDRLVKKKDSLKDYKTKAAQQQLLVETLHIIEAFVRDKSCGSAFNVQNQKSLEIFLSVLSGERSFARHLRNVADRLLEEIQKPSRRFKVKLEDILISSKEKDDPPIRSGRRKRREEEENQDVQEEYLEDSLTKQASHEPPNTPAKPQTPEEKYYICCHFCFLPKCTKFCNGVCGKAFHSVCWEHFQHNHVLPVSATDLEEKNMTYEQWLANINEAQQCRNCTQNTYKFKCEVCFEFGEYFPKQTSKNLQNHNPGKVYRCSAKIQCSRFYHLECLFSGDSHFKIGDIRGKISAKMSKRFVCPSHYCQFCDGTGSKKKKDCSSCIKCCLAYHTKCNDEAVLRLAGNLLLCKLHVQPQSSPLQIAEQYEMMSMSKKGKLRAKRQNKLEENNRKPRIKRQNREPAYEDFKMVPLPLKDYSGLKEDWCRYCGTRFAEDYGASPWGDHKLCSAHSSEWAEDKISLKEILEEPKQPINFSGKELLDMCSISKKYNISWESFLEKWKTR